MQGWEGQPGPRAGTLRPAGRAVALPSRQCGWHYHAAPAAAAGLLVPEGQAAGELVLARQAVGAPWPPVGPPGGGAVFPCGSLGTQPGGHRISDGNRTKTLAFSLTLRHLLPINAPGDGTVPPRAGPVCTTRGARPPWPGLRGLSTENQPAPPRGALRTARSHSRPALRQAGGWGPETWRPQVTDSKPEAPNWGAAAGPRSGSGPRGKREGAAAAQGRAHWWQAAIFK